MIYDCFTDIRILSCSKDSALKTQILQLENVDEPVVRNYIRGLLEETQLDQYSNVYKLNSQGRHWISMCQSWLKGK